MIFKAKGEYNGIGIDVQFSNRLNVLVGNSGTGKSLLISLIDFYCLERDISHIRFDYECAELDEKNIISICDKKEIVLLDNADLYLNQNIIDNIFQNETKVIIISMKDTSRISMSDAASYIVEYSDRKIALREL